MDTYYMSTAKLIDLLKTAYTKGYHGFLDLADSTVEEMLRGLEENKYSPKDVLVNQDFVVNDSILSVSDTTGTVTIANSSGAIDFSDGTAYTSDVLPENIGLEPRPDAGEVLSDEEISLNTGDG